MSKFILITTFLSMTVGFSSVSCAYAEERKKIVEKVILHNDENFCTGNLIWNGSKCIQSTSD